MANKRIKKKRAQQKQRQVLIQSGYNPRTVKNIKGSELNKIEKQVNIKNQYEINRQYLLAQGIDKRIISQKQIYRRTEKFLQDKENIKKWRKETRELHRYDRLIDAGYRKEEIKKSWLRYDKLTDRMIFERLQYKVQYNKKYIGVMYSEIYADEMIIEDLSSMSFEELLEEYINLLDDAQNEPDNSDGFRGVFKIIIGSDKDKVKHACRVWENRGYNISIGKFSKERYQTMFVKNDFSLREYLELLYFVFSHEKNEDIINDYKTFYNYAQYFSNSKQFSMLFPYSI